jgi:hypothetical protein
MYSTAMHIFRIILSFNLIDFRICAILLIKSPLNNYCIFGDI